MWKKLKSISTRTVALHSFLDNDLQRDLEGIHLAQWLVEKDLDNSGFIPNDFEFFVHSQNPIAKKRIYSYLNQYLDNKEPVIKKPKY